MIAAGEDAVPTGQVLQAVRDGVVECGHTASTRYFDIDPALSFDAGVPFGLNTRQMHAWMTQGEGLALTRVLFGKHNILNFPCGYTGAQMGGWFRGEIKTVDDLRGLKIKANGFARQVLARMGAAPVDMPVADTYAALEQGEVDAVAWIGPYDDEPVALQGRAELLLSRLVVGHVATVAVREPGRATPCPSPTRPRWRWPAAWPAPT